ncbi:two-component system activity regulator YycH [uncultured Metabacillus sp.]|uniref:YycH family regulatory protein n=1 Tax=uncultured Metabacillus sp. TaxID=2860135 RepID=UPI002604B4B2|nr:two-component system activity regulator YycH [uncultured Metabacillus sp.]
MNKESIKSAILVILVVISLFFTWNMWSLEPTYEKFEGEMLFESVPIDEDAQRKMYEVITPQQIFIHSGDKHYSSIKDSYAKSLWKEMQNWEYSNQQGLSKQDFEEIVSGTNIARLELRFFDEIPIETFQSMIKWKDETSSLFAFDRIYLRVVKQNEIQKVYFVSASEKEIVEASVNNLDANVFVSDLFSKREQFQPYFAFQAGEDQEILLPENQLEVDNFQYFTEVIDDEKFKNALFSRPRIVKQDVNSTRNRYTDATRELNIYQAQHLVKFANPTLRISNSVDAYTLFEQSYNYLNDHGGWTDKYVLFDIAESEQEVSMIMSIESIPVINSMESPYGPTKITQTWGQNEIAIYQRPSYQLMHPPLTNNSTTLMSGRKVVEIIQNNQLIDASQIYNIFIAYELGSSDKEQIVTVSPVWCIKMKNGELMKVREILEQTVGDENGVE